LPLLSAVPAVIAVNAVLALALSAIAPVVTMLVVGDAPESEWSGRIARLNTFQGYGATAGLVLGTGWTLTVGAVLAAGTAQRSLFVVAAAVGVASAALAVRSLPPERTREIGRRPAGRIAATLARTTRKVRDATFDAPTNRIYWSLRSLSRGRARRIRSDLSATLWAYLGASCLFFTGFAVFWAPLPLFLTRSGFEPGVVFGLYLVNNVASATAFGRAGAASDALDQRLLQGSALGVRGAAFFGVGALATLGIAAGTAGTAGGGLALVPLAVVAGLLVVVGVTWAVIGVTGTAIVSRTAPRRLRGSVLGLYAALSAVAGSVGSLLGGWIAARGFVPAFAVAGALVVAGGAVVLVTRGLSERRAGADPETAEAATD
jgi:MFS family permease